jgi:hypothetical protein
VLATPIGEWSAFGVLGFLIWTAIMSGVGISFTYDAWALDHRAETVQAEVTRTFYDDRGDDVYHANLQWPYEGIEVLVEPAHHHPAAGDFISLEVDPTKPTRVRDADTHPWTFWSIASMALIPAALLITWAHAAHHLHNRRSR